MGSLLPASRPPGHNMGTKLSKANTSPSAPTALEVEDKSATLPPPSSSSATETEANAKSETLPRSGFQRTTGLGKSFRKSMRKLVGKKKVKEEEAEKKESDKVEKTLRTVRQRRENRRRTSRLHSRK